MHTIRPFARTSIRRLRFLGTVSRALALCSGLALAAPACMPSAAAPALATGERPVTGVVRFDRLFAEVHSSLLAVQEARTEEADAREALARRLALMEAAPIDVLGARLRERTARLAQDGLTLELEFTGIDDGDGSERQVDANAEAVAEGHPLVPDTDDADDAADADLPPPTATLRTPGREPQRRELRLLEALAQAAISGATIYANMGRERRRTERLLAEVVELEGRVDTSFVDPADRERVRAKLAEAKGLLPKLNAQAREVSGSADILVSLLDEAANTAPVARRRGSSPPRDAVPQQPPAASRPAPPTPPSPAPARGPTAGASSAGVAASAANPAAANPFVPSPGAARAPAATPSKVSPPTPNPPAKASPPVTPSPSPAAPSSPPAGQRVAPVSPAR